MASFGPSAWPPLVATSSEETLLLTRTGEVLVCRHAAEDDQNDIDDNEDGVAPFNIDISKTTSSEFLDDCSLNANSFEASVTGRNKLHRQQQRQSLQKAWAECCEPERFCDLSNQDNKHVNHLNSSGRGGGLFGGSEEGLLDTANSNYTEHIVNGMGSKLKINQDGHHKATAVYKAKTTSAATVANTATKYKKDR
eukprot:scaffold38693_cov150-Skeletonema_dohrnii-CCMP3373.AAC.1